MWRGFELALACYFNLAVFEWKQRGFANSMSYVNDSLVDWLSVPTPPWLGYRVFHRSHQSNLVRKDPTHYRKFFRRVPSTLPYYWPKEASNAR